MIRLTKVQLLLMLIVSYTIGFENLNRILEGLMPVPNDHKVHRYKFVFKGDIEVANMLW